eukprot:scaffold256546_cov20-Prasinocladus_malaysianus.AAC.1
MGTVGHYSMYLSFRYEVYLCGILRPSFIDNNEALHRLSQCRWSDLGHKLTARGYALLAVRPRR